MKKYPLAILFTILYSCGFGQKPDEAGEEPFNIEKDTMYAMVDHQGTIKNLPGMPYIRKWWPENGKYKENLFDAEGKYLVRIAWYKDKTCKEKDGPYETYYKNGMAKDSGTYINNQKQGVFAGWYDKGMPHYIQKYFNGLPIDTGFVFRDDGTMATLTITDSNGNGLQQDYYNDLKIKLKGRIREGKKSGKWILKREDGSVMMELHYMADSLAATTCFEQDGKTIVQGDCIYEKPAEFVGGNAGWAAYIAKNLRYPFDAISKNIQGVVRVKFIVLKDGSIDEIEILSSPDKSLSNEVIRLLKKSPPWIPAIQYNQPVIYKHIQPVYFRLE